MSNNKNKKNKVGVVMHEFKEGKLKTRSGKKVTNFKQAIAIALNAAGLSNKSGNTDYILDNMDDMSMLNGHKVPGTDISDCIEENVDLNNLDNKNKDVYSNYSREKYKNNK